MYGDICTRLMSKPFGFGVMKINRMQKRKMILEFSFDVQE